ncbi:hypothetical protein Lesp02_77410 [Lentzea sp. NBRC 105346]|nr:hypothetical protein [Lentzea sp. NBRC 105346]GLZ35554.1 hypothetical protein Lesp02_77410 [Lentzea sp. NBRC 105346]
MRKFLIAVAAAAFLATLGATTASADDDIQVPKPGQCVPAPALPDCTIVV